MTIQHHLSDDLLMGYAAGNLPEAFSLIVATHISICDECRAGLAAYEALGGAVVADCGSVAMSEGCLDAVMARLDHAVPSKPMPQSVGILPAPLADYVGGGLDRVKWHPIGLGVAQLILPTAKGATARLLYIPAGQSVPDHGHRGMELTLVLQGAFRDESSRFARGDVEIATSADQHSPIAELGEDCVCLAVTDAPLRFTALLPRLLQPLFRI
jgi:putative transcriptional regulator